MYTNLDEQIPQKQDLQKDLIDVLTFMSTGLLKPEEVKDCHNRFVKIYLENSFRHSYSEISNFLISCFRDKKSDQIETIKSNIEAVMNFITKDDATAYDHDPYKSLYKLFDHINLELIRYQYYNEEVRDVQDLSEQLETAKRQLDDTYKDIDFVGSFKDTQKYINEARQDIRRSKRISDSLQTQMVSILGVFAAIIVSFFGGLSIFGSIFNNLSQKEFYRVGIMGSLVGLVFFDVIVFLLCAIGYFINKPLALANKLGSTKNFYKTCFKAVNIVLICFFVIFTALGIIQRLAGVKLT